MPSSSCAAPKLSLLLALLFAASCSSDAEPTTPVATPVNHGSIIRLLDDPLLEEHSTPRSTVFDGLLASAPIWVRNEIITAKAWRKDRKLKGTENAFLRMPATPGPWVHPAQNRVGEKDMRPLKRSKAIPKAGEFVLDGNKLLRPIGVGPDGAVHVDYPIGFDEIADNISSFHADGRVIPKELRIGSDCRRAVIAPVPSTYVYQVALPDQARLDFAVAVRPREIRILEDGIESRRGKRVTHFQVDLELEDGTKQTVWEFVLKNNQRNKFVEASVDLTAWSNQTVRLHLSHSLVTPASDAAWYNFAAWGEPMVWSGSPQQQPNILVLLLDTLRADRLGCYGWERARTPRLDLIASQGARFSDAMSASSWTLPAHASLFTSTFPSQHGLWDDQRLPNALRTVAEVFSNNDYRTGAFTERGFLHEKHGFARGFETFNSKSRDCRQTFQKAAEWIEKRTTPFFAFVHTYKVHSPYAPAAEFADGFVREYHGNLPASVDVPSYPWGQNGPPPSDEDIQYVSDLYDAEIAELDDAVGEFIDRIEKAGAMENTLLIITSDHGEEFFDHGSVLHGMSLYQEQLHVPLIMVWKGRVEGGQNPGHPVHLVDVAPTALAAAGLTVPQTWVGRPLSIEAPAAGRPLFVPMRIHFSKNRAGDDAVALREGNMKYIEYRGTPRKYDKHKGPLLFDLAVDPGEQHNLLVSESEGLWADKVKALRRQYGQLGNAESFERSQESLRELEKLGYAGGDE